MLVADDPLAALQRLATAWRRELDAAVIGVTGSVGKTSTKQLIAALIAPHRRVAANPANFNTEIGLPLAVLAAPEGTEVLVLEMGMRGFGQIDELARIAEPDVGVITNVGPVHLELVGSSRAWRGRRPSCSRTCRSRSIPADEPLLEPYLRDGPGRRALRHRRVARGLRPAAGDDPRARAARRARRCRSRSRHQLVNLLAAVAAAQAVGVEPSGPWTCSFGALRGEHVALPSGVVVINDCYNANPLSMRAALDDLATQAPQGRRVAVLGDMLELGAGEAEAHRAIGAYAASSGVDVLVAVGPLSAVDAAGVRRRVARRRGRRARPPRVVAGLVRPGRRRAGEGVARHRPGDGRRRRWPVGEVLIAGTASLLICVFLSPKFISFLRAREFGQNIREDGPEGHHAKAGTPTMGGIIIFTAIAVPFLLLTDFDWRAIGVFGVADRVRAAGLRRRLHEARQAALAGAARADEALRHGADLDRAVARRDHAARSCRTR